MGHSLKRMNAGLDNEESNAYSPSASVALTVTDHRIPSRLKVGSGNTLDIRVPPAVHSEEDVAEVISNPSEIVMCPVKFTWVVPDVGRTTVNAVLSTLMAIALAFPTIMSVLVATSSAVIMTLRSIGPPIDSPVT